MTSTPHSHISQRLDGKNAIRRRLCAWLPYWTPKDIRKSHGLLATLQHLNDDPRLTDLMNAYGAKVAERAIELFHVEGNPAHEAGRLHAWNAFTLARGIGSEERNAVKATAELLQAHRKVYGADPISIAQFVAKGTPLDDWLDFIVLTEEQELSRILIDLLHDNDLII